ncbi:CopG family ribbon-helix-helix protein [Tomitella gaofuii]|uniref:CopG family ribbon-helix-helix protein n=1 Tax=Tomitella gaofuii TaxID=2760083 RepID=UPI0015FABC47|nr:ribbon-helix-helix domain-containing protein [Tomitella gaofuii]
MKISVSLPEEDLEILDTYMRESGLPSRSSAIQRAVRMLRNVDLEDDYAAAWSEWESSGDAAVWESASGDGLADAAR